jgi:nicotinamide riboside kinase
MSGPKLALCVAVLGAESTGKTTLTQALAPRLAALSGLHVAVVAEHLRQWCEQSGRTPKRAEQAEIAAEQARQIQTAAAQFELVLCDTTPVMTAAYSHLVFGDSSLDDSALAWHQQHIDLTLLTALDLPWVPDGHQRDGEQVREPVHARLRALLAAAGIGFVVISGHGEQRTHNALEALGPLLYARLRSSPQRWRCASCDDPACRRLAHSAA